VSDDELLRRFLGQALRRQREAHALTLHDLGEAAGISWKHIGEIERGTANIRLTTLFTLAHALDMTATDLVHRVEIAVVVAEHQSIRRTRGDTHRMPLPADALLAHRIIVALDDFRAGRPPDQARLTARALAEILDESPRTIVVSLMALRGQEHITSSDQQPAQWGLTESGIGLVGWAHEAAKPPDERRSFSDWLREQEEA